MRLAPPALAAAVMLIVAFAEPAAAQSPTEDMQQYTDEVARLVRDVSSKEKDTLGSLQTAVRRLAFQILKQMGTPDAEQLPKLLH